MKTTPPSSNLPEAPPWLNLDLVMPKQALVDIAQAKADAEALIPEAKRVFAEIARLEELYNDFPEGIAEYLWELTGIKEMNEARWYLTALAQGEGIRAGVPTEELIERLKARYGPSGQEEVTA